jgi:integrase
MPRKKQHFRSLIPSLRHHRHTRQAYCELDGKRHYFGRFGSREAKLRYDALVADWLANGRMLPEDPNDFPSPISIAELVALYLPRCQEYYKDADGNSTTTLPEVRLALRDLKSLYGPLAVDQFGPRLLAEIRSRWVAKNLSLSTVNGRVAIVRRLFRWGISQEQVPVTVHQALETLENLKPGRCPVKPAKVVEAVRWEDVEATLPYLPKPLQAVVPCNGTAAPEALRSCSFAPVTSTAPAPSGKHRLSVTRRSTVESYAPSTSASRHRQSCVHSSCVHSYEHDAYRRAVTRACAKAISTAAAESKPKPNRWHPHQLRHALATRVREQFGLEAAQATLGHSRASVTEIHAKVNEARAVEVAASIG